jgi:hypothetical protein
MILICIIAKPRPEGLLNPGRPVNPASQEPALLCKGCVGHSVQSTRRHAPCSCASQARTNSPPDGLGKETDGHPRPPSVNSQLRICLCEGLAEIATDPGCMSHPMAPARRQNVRNGGTEIPRRSLVFCHREIRQCRADLPPGLHRARVPEDCHSRFAAMPRRHRPQSVVRNDGTARPVAVFCAIG